MALYMFQMNVAETFYRTSESPPFLIKGAFVLQLSLKEMGKPLGCLKINFCAKYTSPLLILL